MQMADEQWEVLLMDHHDGYIDWAEFERNQSSSPSTPMACWAGRSQGAGDAPYWRGCSPAAVVGVCPAGNFDQRCLAARVVLVQAVEAGIAVGMCQATLCPVQLDGRAGDG
jgi:hypothetical protein